MIENKRIGNLSFSQATYLLPKNEWTENPSYHINYHYPNAYYGKENEFIKEGDWYLYPDNQHCRVHKDCFKNPQSCMAIASFDCDKERYYELSFVGDRPLSINEKEREIFWELVEYGYKQLNKTDENA